MSRRARSIAANLKRREREAKGALKRITGALADLAATAVREAERTLHNARRTPRRRGGTGKLRRAVRDLDVLLERTGRIVEQTRLRLSGITPPGSTRLVSLHDPDARPKDASPASSATSAGSSSQLRRRRGMASPQRSPEYAGAAARPFMDTIR